MGNVRRGLLITGFGLLGAAAGGYFGHEAGIVNQSDARAAIERIDALRASAAPVIGQVITPAALETFRSTYINTEFDRTANVQIIEDEPHAATVTGAFFGGIMGAIAGATADAIADVRQVRRSRKRATEAFVKAYTNEPQ